MAKINAFPWPKFWPRPDFGHRGQNPRGQNVSDLSWPKYFGRQATGLQPQACVAKIFWPRFVTRVRKKDDFGHPTILATVVRTHTGATFFHLFWPAS